MTSNTAAVLPPWLLLAINRKSHVVKLL